MDEAVKGRLMTTICVSTKYLLVPTHPGCPGQNPQSRKMVVCACKCMHAHFVYLLIVLSLLNIANLPMLFAHIASNSWLLLLDISVFGRSVYLTLISRRSNQFAGTRFLKRGGNASVSASVCSLLSLLLQFAFVALIHHAIYKFIAWHCLLGHHKGVHCL